MQTVHKSRIIHHSSLVHMLLILVREYDFRILYLHKTDFPLLCHCHKCPIIHFLRPLLQYIRKENPIEQKNDHCNYKRIDQKRLPGGFNFFHSVSPFI